MIQDSLWPDPPKKCRDCFDPLVDDFSTAYGQCTPCNHAEVDTQLLGFLRRGWHDHPEKRAAAEAWAMCIRRGWTAESQRAAREHYLRAKEESV